MGIGLNSPKNRKKHAPRGTFTLHRNSEEEALAEERLSQEFQEYPKYIADADTGEGSDCLARDAGHEADIRARLAPKADEKPAKSEKAKKDAA